MRYARIWLWLLLEACATSQSAKSPPLTAARPASPASKETAAEKFRREAKRRQEEDDERRRRDEFIHRNTR